MGLVNFNEEFKDKNLKRAFNLIVTVAIVIFLLFAGVIVKTINDGKHVKLGPFEFNIPDSSNSKKSTPNKQIPTEPTISDTDKPKPITLNKPATRYSKPIVQAASSSNKRISNNTATHKQDTAKQNIKYNITAPVTQSAIGDGATVHNNFNGLKPRVLNDAEKLDIISAIRLLTDQNKHWGKNPMINFNLPVSDNESLNYAEQINGFLYANGYDRIMSHNVMYGGRRFGNFGIKKDTSNATSYISISIYPQSNINQ